MIHYFLSQGSDGNMYPINATVKVVYYLFNSFTHQSLEYIFKFIKGSLLKQEMTETDKKELLECLAGLSELMKKKSPTLIVAQILALKVWKKQFSHPELQQCN